MIFLSPVTMILLLIEVKIELHGIEILQQEVFGVRIAGRYAPILTEEY